IILIIPNIAAQSRNVQDTGCDAQVKMVQSQIEAYTLNEGSAPATINALVPDYLTNDQISCQNGDNITINNGEAVRSSRFYYVRNAPRSFYRVDFNEPNLY